METTFIYALIDPIDNQVRYIGKSNNPDKRFLEHLRDYSKTHKTCWIKSVLKTGNIPELEILDEVESEEWKFWEGFYYELYKSWGFKLTNSVECGIGPLKVNEYTTNKRIATLRENIKTGKTVFKTKPILKIDINTGEIVEKYKSASQAAKANKMRKQRIDELVSGSSQSITGKIKRIQQNGYRYIKEEEYNPNTNYKLISGKSTSINQLDLEGNIIKEFKRVNDASVELGISPGQIVNCAAGKQKTCHGFIFKYP